MDGQKHCGGIILIFTNTGESSHHILPVPPLSLEESRFLWASLRYRLNVNEMSLAKGLTDEMKYQKFRKTNAVPYAQKVAAVVAFGQKKFIGKCEHWFRPMCEELGFEVSANFVSYGYIASLFVVCADSKLFESCAKDIKGTWVSSKTAR